MTFSTYPGPDPSTVALGMPVMDYKPDAHTVMGMMQVVPFIARPLVLGGMSDVALARNCIVHSFMTAPENFQWLVFVDADIGFGPIEWCQLMEGDSPLVCGPYARKIEGDNRVVSHGLGFTRISREIFDKLISMNTEDGSPLVRQFMHEGELKCDFFPCGITGQGDLFREDQGFYMLAQMAGYEREVRRHIQLVHYGRKGYTLPPVKASHDKH